MVKNLQRLVIESLELVKTKNQSD
jgi:hypothetical protein